MRVYLYAFLRLEKHGRIYCRSIPILNYQRGCVISLLWKNSCKVCFYMPAISSLAAGTPTTGSAAPAPCIEIHSAFAEMGAGLMKVPAFVCVFVRGMGIFALKCGQNVGFYGRKLEKNGGFVTEIWGEGGDAKRQSRHHIFDFGTLFVGASVYVYKWTNRHCNGLRVSGLQQAGGEGGRGPWPILAQGGRLPSQNFLFFSHFFQSSLSWL